MSELADGRGLVRSYAGLLDDVLLRYGKGTEFLQHDFFNKMIVKSILFGSGIFLNDGYLVNHPTSRYYLRREDSVLRVMISTGFIRVLSREPNEESLARMPHLMAERGNRSFVELTRSDEWKDELEGAYRAVVRAIFSSNSVRPWPKFDMSAGFCDLMERVFASPAREMGLIHITDAQLYNLKKEFDRLDPRRGNARDKFEKAAQHTLGAEHERPMAEIMEVANQAYHYNFGMTLTAEEPYGVAADTTIGAAFDELLQVRKVERAQIEDIPLVSLPTEIPLNDGELFLPFVRLDTGISNAKRDYMQALANLIAENATDLPTLKSLVAETTEQYMARMKEYFTSKFDKASVEKVFDASLTMGVAQGDATAATAGPNAQLAVAMQRASRHVDRAFLLERFEIKDVTPEYRLPDHQVIRLGDIRSQIASLAFDPAAAGNFVAKLPCFA